MAPSFSRREPIIDLIRFFSIFVVMGSHFYPRWLANAPGTPIFLRWLIQSLFLNGHFGVTCFFVVSGFLITRMMAESSPRFSKLDLADFYVKRIARLWPLLGVILLAGIFWVVWNPPMGGEMDRMKIFWMLPTVHPWAFWISIATFSFNCYPALAGSWGMTGLYWAVLWTLAIEEQFYLFYPILFKKIHKRETLCALLIGLVCLGYLFRAGVEARWGDNLAWGQWFSPAAFDQLAVGCLAYWARPAFSRWTQAGAWRAWGVLVLGLLLLSAGYLGLGLDSTADFVFAPSLVALGCALILLSGLEIKMFQNDFWAWLSAPGRLSYGGYLWHLMILYFLMPLILPWGRLEALGAWMAAVWIWGWLSYRCFEMPMNRLIRSWFKIAPSRTL